ncbi:MAG: hypothetical protein RR825_02300 [Ruthenibacterium sp.]
MDLHVGDTVRINRKHYAYRVGHTEWTGNYTPTQGIVVYISPHGWVTVMTVANGRQLYREAFWIEDLTEVV